jgi:hypothetical protein
MATSCYDEFYIEGRVTTDGATEIGSSSAVLNGSVKIVSEGKHAEPEILCGFAIGTNHSNLINIADFIHINNGSFSYTVTDLYPNTKYYVKAYIRVYHNTLDYDDYGNIEEDWKDIQELYYGNLIEFTTNDGVILPTLTTQQPSEITATSAILHGNIYNVGTPAYTKRGFVYGKNQNPRLDNTGLPESDVTMIEVPGVGDGDFSVSIDELNTNTTYYICAYASIDNDNVAYGNQVSFVAETLLPYIEFPAAAISVQKEDITANNTNWTYVKILSRVALPIGAYPR